jgi:hypothetical protein
MRNGIGELLGRCLDHNMVIILGVPLYIA